MASSSVTTAAGTATFNASQDLSEEMDLLQTGPPVGLPTSMLHMSLADMPSEEEGTD